MGGASLPFANPSNPPSALRPLPPSFHQFLDTNIKPAVKDDTKFRQITATLLQFVNAKLGQDMVLKMLSQCAGREIAVAILQHGLKERIFSQNPPANPSPQLISPAHSTSTSPAKQTFYPTGPAPIDPKKTVVNPAAMNAAMGMPTFPAQPHLMSNPALMGMMQSHLNVPGFVNGFPTPTQFYHNLKMNGFPTAKPGVPPTITGIPMGMFNVPGAMAKKPEPEDDKKAIKDLTDVTRLAAVDVKHEASLSLPEVQESKEVTEEPAFLTTSLLKKKMNDIANSRGLKSVHDDAFLLAKMAVQAYMRNVIEGLYQVASQRSDGHKMELPSRIVQDPKSEMKQYHIRKAEEEKKRKAEADLKGTDEYKKIRDDPKNLLNKAAKINSPGAVTFTQQNLSQLQELRNLINQGKQLTGQQQNSFNALKAQLQKYAQLQQQQKDQAAAEAQASGTNPKPLIVSKGHSGNRVCLRDVQVAKKILNLKLGSHGKRRKKATMHLY
eukprot:TRINITY_DN9363_c0_g1_i1.p1 TRINITY_DN9363_c0_g1~~TRINITY_DN9363_c0_g1_i1.p1  ORF type:complete len:555 (+),score=164.30 TRINITY_DN9363_c0_g1_i1:181-1665(+)